jgi:hypothetical protein
MRNAAGKLASHALVFKQVRWITSTILPRLRRLVAAFSDKRRWIHPKSIYVRSVVKKVALGQALLIVFLFYPAVSFHSCFVLIFIYMLVLTEDKRVKPGNLPKGTGLSEIGKHFIEKGILFFPALEFYSLLPSQGQPKSAGIKLTPTSYKSDVLQSEEMIRCAM